MPFLWEEVTFKFRDSYLRPFGFTDLLGINEASNFRLCGFERFLLVILLTSLIRQFSQVTFAGLREAIPFKEWMFFME